MTAIIAMLAAPGCRHYPNLLPESTRVAIIEFTIADGARITDDKVLDEQPGRRFAELLAERLQRRGRTAAVVKASDSITDGLIVSGRITRMTWGGGFSEFACEGEVRRTDGTRVSVFSDERVGTGFTNGGARENAMLKVRNNVSQMIFAGEYVGGRPGSPGVLRPQATPAGGPAVGAPERLRQLETLRTDGLITEGEYQERRQRIIDGL